MPIVAKETYENRVIPTGLQWALLQVAIVGVKERNTQKLNICLWQRLSYLAPLREISATIDIHN